MTDRAETWKHFEKQLASMIEGRMFLPNFEEEANLSQAVANWACLPIPETKGLAKLAGDDYAHWARYLLGRTQGGQLDGTGWVMLYDHGKGRIGRFAICQHKKVAHAGANPMRGWHPGHCSECGLDLTVDSGD